MDLTDCVLFCFRSFLCRSHTENAERSPRELSAKSSGGVVINFEKIGPDPPAVEVKVENGLDSNGNSKGTFMVMS